uniref:small monomeric GTPase n=1 Tax=Rousettus aegyptiacus TaxID=9407 RepID=A0A7J8GF22_ROUAE|nr:RAB40B, member RAS oncogene family [Rousettus aegyptiacus]
MGAGAGGRSVSAMGSPVRAYDFLLKFLLVGDSDVGKGEILASLQDGAAESPYAHPAGVDYKTTTILLDGRRVKLQLWEASGQGRLCTIFRSYSRGAQGVVLVYDIANRWSFDGIDRWLKEVDEHAPGVPKILVGNRLHLAFKRQVPTEQARAYAERLGVTFFEVSPLCNFNITESFVELARTVLLRHGMDGLWRPSKGPWCCCDCRGLRCLLRSSAGPQPLPSPGPRARPPEGQRRRNVDCSFASEFSNMSL